MVRHCRVEETWAAKYATNVGNGADVTKFSKARVVCCVGGGSQSVVMEVVQVVDQSTISYAEVGVGSGSAWGANCQSGICSGKEIVEVGQEIYSVVSLYVYNAM